MQLRGALLAAFLGACGSSYASEEPPPAAIEAGAIDSGEVPTNDAGVEASAPEGGGDAQSPACAAGAAICDDFAGPTLSKKWTAATHPSGELSILDGALRVQVRNVTDSPSIELTLTQPVALDAKAKKVTLTFRLYVERFTMEYVRLGALVMRGPTLYRAEGVAIARVNGTNIGTSLAGGSAAFLPLIDREWHAVEMTLVRKAADATLLRHLTVDGKLAAPDESFSLPPNTNTVLTLGAFATSTKAGELDVRLDDVALRLE